MTTMMKPLACSRRTARRARRAFANDNDALVPEVWAKYTVAILEKYMVAGRLVHRDFERDVARFGDTVNTRRPVEATVDRKTDADDIEVQDASAVNIPVVLNMHPYTSFIIKDGEASLSMEDLVALHLDGRVKAMAEFIDMSVTGQYPQFLATAGCGGQLGGLTNSNYQKFLAETVERMDSSNCPQDGRNILVTPKTKMLFLQNQPLVGADQRGSLSALEQADMGLIYGVRHYMTQSMRSIPAVDITSSAFLVNNAAGYQEGVTTITVDTGTGSLADGVWFKLKGKPYKIVSATDTLGNTTSITFTPGLREVIADNDPLVVYDPWAVNEAAGYAVGWSKKIAYDGATILPKVGGAVSFGTQSQIYSIVQANSTHIWLDRALEAAVTDDLPINPLPPGDYNMAFRKNAIALICRGLEPPRAGAGATSVLVNHGGYPLRITIAYDYKKQGHAVTIDCLMGIKTIDAYQGAVLLA